MGQGFSLELLLAGRHDSKLPRSPAMQVIDILHTAQQSQ
jgi:hypothetical protein